MDKPEAIRLAECLERDCQMNWPDYDNQMDASAELRRQHAEIERLRAEVEAFRKDAARMDWIEANPHTPIVFHRKSKWFIRESFNYENDCFKTARQAIDAALQSTEVQP